MKQTSVQLPGPMMMELQTQGGSPRRIVTELLEGYVGRYLCGQARVLPFGRGEGPKERDYTLPLVLDDALWDKVRDVLDAERVRVRWKVPSIRGIVFAALEEGSR